MYNKSWASFNAAERKQEEEFHVLLQVLPILHLTYEFDFNISHVITYDHDLMSNLMFVNLFVKVDAAIAGKRE